MSEILSWDVTDENNTDLFPENMAYSQVNNSARAVQGALARWYADQALVASGSSNAFVVTTNVTYAGYEGMAFTFKANHTITGAPTINVNSLGAVPIRDKQGAILTDGMIASGQYVPVVYDTGGYFRAQDILVSDAQPVSLTVMQFGAAGDGVTDDSDAINLATAAMRALIDAGQSVELIFPSGNYFTQASLDFTNLRPDGGDSSWVVTAYGARIEGACTDRPVMDFMHSQWGTIQGVHIYGNQTLTPRSGIQLARGFLKANNRPQTSSNINLSDCRTTGYFGWAGFYNYASEVCLQTNCTWINDDSTAVTTEDTITDPNDVFDAPYSMILDADNTWGCDSDYYTQTIPQNTSTSMILQGFQNCAFMRPNGGPTIWMSSGIAQLSMSNCYSACLDGDAVIIWCSRFSTAPTSWRKPFNWNFELHAESDAEETQSFRNMFRFIPEDDNSGSPISIPIKGFRWVDHNNHCDEACFRLSEIFPAGSQMTISDAVIGIRKFRGAQSEDDTDGGPPSLGIFYPSNHPTTSGWAVSGRLAIPSASSAMPIGLLRFSGEFIPSSLTSEFTEYPLGSYQIQSHEINRMRIKGDIEFYGEDTQTYDGTTLDLAQAFSIINGRIKNEDGTIRLPVLSADPTAANGAIYYNNSTHKVRACLNSVWTDL